MKVFTNFAQISTDFARILGDSARIFTKPNVLGVPLHPASYTSVFKIVAEHTQQKCVLQAVKRTICKQKSKNNFSEILR